MENDELLINFLSGTSPDSEKRFINDIINLNENEIEETHNFIQWIYPTKEKSIYNPSAPIISSNFKYLFLNNEIAQENFCKTCRLFMGFIGMDCNKKGEIYLAKNKTMFYDRPEHNLLRISRVLNSLNQIGKQACSKKLFLQLQKIHDDINVIIPECSYKIWQDTQNKNE